MRKLFAIFLLLALCMVVLTGEKRIVGARVNNQLMLLRIDLANYSMDCSVDGTTWSAISVGGVGDVTGPSSSTDGNLVFFDGATGKIIKDSGVSASSFATAGANSNITSLTGLTTALGVLQGGTGATTASGARTSLGAAASGTNSDIISLTGLTTPLSVSQGGTGLSSLGAAGQIWTVNAGATAAGWATPASSSGVDLSGYDSSYNGHYARYLYVSAGNDSYTKLLIDAQGTNGSTTFVDSSSTGRAVTASGNVSISTVQYKFGTSSAYFSGGYLSLADDTGFDVGAGDFTIDFWMRPTADTARQSLFFNTTDTYSIGLEFGFGGTRNIATWVTSTYGSWDILQSDTGGLETSGIGSTSIPLDTWTHVAFVRHGTSWMLFINGVLDFTRTRSGTVLASSEPKLIGTAAYRSAFSGYLAAFRFSKGVARWTSGFTPPATAYSTEAQRLLYVDSSALSAVTTSVAGLMSAADKTKLDALFTSVTITAQTESYTLVLSDKSKLITMSNASANTLTIPLNSGVAFPTGTWIDIVTIGAGTCTITAASGVTLNGTDGGTKDLAQWAGTRLYKIAENTWITR